MKYNIFAAQLCWRLGSALVVAATCVAAGAQVPDPTKPSSTNTGLEAKPVLPVGSGNYLRHLDEPGLPWSGLYNTDGSFVPESSFGGASAATREKAPTMAKHSMMTSTQGGDARGVVRKLDLASGKVTLKHGPIQSLDMPGMTMSFRAKDPALLNGLKPGDEVDFDVVIEGTKFFITGIRK